MEERLQKYMASCGIASRRKCEEYIISGQVKVNGKIANELGVKVNPDTDIVEFDNKIITPEKTKVYIMLNKPTGYITSLKDEKGRLTILDLVKVPERIYPIGRLDYDSSGLILMTNDGDIYNKIIHPRVEITKQYMAIVEGQFSEQELQKFKTGIDISDYITAPAEIEVIKYSNNKSTIKIGIHEGKNRQIRRMCEALNHNVLELERISVGELELANLMEGEWRNLTNQELTYLKNL